MMEDGFYNNRIKRILDSLIQKLKDFKFFCPFTLTNGDRFYNRGHERFNLAEFFHHFVIKKATKPIHNENNRMIWLSNLFSD